MWNIINFIELKGSNKMGFAELFLIAVSLSMDAMAISLCKGLNMKKLCLKQAGIIALFFGGFQALMPLIGYFCGKFFEQYINKYDHWVAFVLLSVIGAKMIVDVIKGDDEEPCGCCGSQKTDIKEIFVLAIATSIDALAVGITFAFVKVNIFAAVSLIGVITFILSLFGVVIGHKFGAKYKDKAALCGGIVLVLIGIKILLEGLGIIG